MLKLMALLGSIFFFSNVFGQTITLNASRTERLLYSGQSSAVMFTQGLIHYELPATNSSTSPAVAYVPIGANGAPNYITTKSTFSSQVVLDQTDTNNAFLGVLVDIATNSSAQDLQFAVKDDDDKYRVVNFFNSAAALIGTELEINNSSQSGLYFVLSLRELCDQAGTECTDEHVTDTSAIVAPPVIKGQLEIAMFLQPAPSAFTLGAEVTNLDTAKVVFMTFEFSDKFPALITSGLDLNISQIKPGDGKATVIFTGGDQITNLGSDHFQTWAVESTAPVGSDFQDPLVSAILHENNPVLAGDLDVRSLSNGITHNIAIFQVNKHRFASRSSNSVAVIPEVIQAFLEKQSCYLLSAGFQKEHYVLDYFRHIRDDFILKVDLGRKMVNWYYATAPKYTPLIYNSKFVSAIVRFFGHALFFLFKIFPVLILIAVAFVGTRLMLRTGSWQKRKSS